MESTLAISPACGRVLVLLNFGDQLRELFITCDVAFDILVDSEDGVSMRGSPCLKLDSDGIVD